jgi:hypothetical protein
MIQYNGRSYYGRTAQAVRNKLERKGCTVQKIKRIGGPRNVDSRGMYTYKVKYHTKK